MPYKPTGKPPGRPRKDGLPPSRRSYISATAPEPPRPEPDTAPPMLGQRKRVRPRRPSLLPTPLTA